MAVTACTHSNTGLHLQLCSLPLDVLAAWLGPFVALLALRLAKLMLCWALSGVTKVCGVLVCEAGIAWLEARQWSCTLGSLAPVCTPRSAAGKGKLADVLAGDYDVVARFNGGNNAGHTVKVGEHKFAFHLLPCGLVRENTRNLLGNGTCKPRAQLR